MDNLMGTQIQAFDFDPDTKITAEWTDDGEQVLSGAELARACGLTQPDKALARVDANYKVTRISNTGGPARIFLREPGVYQFLSTVRHRKDSPLSDKIVRFRKWVFEKVLPSIRRTGSYTTQTTPALPAPKPTLEIGYLAAEYRGAYELARIWNLDGNPAFISANNFVRSRHGVDIHTECQLQLPSPGNLALLTPTEIGQRHNVSAVSVNIRLCELGLQTKPEATWKLTDAGKEHGVYLDVGKAHSNGTPIQQIKWRESVIPLLGYLPFD